MTAPIVFLDTETTGVHPGRVPWEIAMILRDDSGQQEMLIQIEDVDLSAADPFGLRVGGFYARQWDFSQAPTRQPAAADRVPAEHREMTRIMPEGAAARAVEAWTRGAHLVGAVPNFDAETLDAMLRRHRLLPAWHYHLIDVEALAVGWVHGAYYGDRERLPAEEVALPWDSEVLSRRLGVEPAPPEERHTALGDARWAMRLYDAITGGTG